VRAPNRVNLRGSHGNHITEWSWMILGGRPKHWMVRRSVWEAALKVGEDHERLRLDALLFDVFEARTEAGPAAANWFERNRLSLVKDSGIMNLGVEIEHMHPLSGYSGEGERCSGGIPNGVPERR
jgi:hypothetical protein